MDVAAWLRTLGLEQYEKAFRDNAVDAEVLPKLTAEDLKELGVALVGHRRKILAAIAFLEGAGGEPAHGERRQVTVLFADLAGYTELSRALDAEEVHALLERFFACADRVVAAHGGHVDKHIGDCVMAVFGAPVAHGNDAERAVSAALGIRAVMPDVSAEVGRPVGVHIGVAAGQVVASRVAGTGYSEYTVTGETVNLASRLTGAAGAGEILISEETRRMLAERIETTRPESLTIKGFAEKVRAWRVTGMKPAAEREGRPFVGRRGEQRLFEAALAACRESGRGQVFCVRGEAGIGKTRLVEEIRHAARAAGFACHTVLLLDFGAGRDAIRSLARSLVGLDATGSAEAAREPAAAALSSDLVEADDAANLNDLLDLPQPTSLRPLYEAMDSASRSRGQERVMARLLERAARERPRLLVVEDLHWADRLTLVHLARLTTTVARQPALLVMTVRAEGDPLDAAWRAEAAGGSLTTVELGPLPPDDARALAEATLVTENAALAERCIERAAGNPLFLEQLLRHAAESGETGVPGSVQSLVQARLDRLAPVEKAAVQAASVLGQRFARETLRHLVRGEADGGAEATLSPLFVRPDTAAGGDGETFLFAHALIRDTVYDTLLKSRRRALHRRAAEWYAMRDPVLRAEHLERAEDPEAARAYLAAARVQAAEYRQEAALQLVERGLALTGADGRRADRFALTSLQGELLHDLGAMAAAGRAFRAALDAAGDDEERCKAWIGLATVKRVTDDLPGAVADLDRAEAVAERCQLVAERARIRFLRGNLCFPRGDIEGCLREHGMALELAQRACAAELEAMALGGLGDAEYMRGRMLSARERFRRCVELAARNGFGRIEVANRPMLAFTLWFEGDAKAALTEAEAAIEAAARVGHRRAEMIARHAAYFCRHAMADFDAALSHAESALALARQLGARRFEPEALAFRAELHRAAGRRAAAIADAEEAVRISRETGPTFLGPFALGTLARVSDDPVRRQAALDAAEALLRAGAVSHNHLLFRRDAIDASLEAGAWAEAERHAAALEGYTRAEKLPLCDFAIARARTLAALGRSAEADASARLQHLRTEAERLGMRIAIPSLDTALARLADTEPG